MASIFITGGAGFIGSQMAERLLAEGHAVVSYDNLILGKREFLATALKNPKFRFAEADLLDLALGLLQEVRVRLRHLRSAPFRVRLAASMKGHTAPSTFCSWGESRGPTTVVTSGAGARGRVSRPSPCWAR